MKNPLTPAGIFFIVLICLHKFLHIWSALPSYWVTRGRKHEKVQDCMGIWKLKRVYTSWDDHSNWKS